MPPSYRRPISSFSEGKSPMCLRLSTSSAVFVLSGASVFFPVPVVLILYAPFDVIARDEIRLVDTERSAVWNTYVLCITENIIVELFVIFAIFGTFTIKFVMWHL